MTFQEWFATKKKMLLDAPEQGPWLLAFTESITAEAWRRGAENSAPTSVMSDGELIARSVLHLTAIDWLIAHPDGKETPSPLGYAIQNAILDAELERRAKARSAP